MTEEMLLQTIEESTEVVTEPITTAVETTTETVTTSIETITETVTTVSTVDYSKLAEIDVDLLNRFLWVGTSFIIACLFWFVCKKLYALLRMFF